MDEVIVVPIKVAKVVLQDSGLEQMMFLAPYFYGLNAELLTSINGEAVGLFGTGVVVNDRFIEKIAAIKFIKEALHPNDNRPITNS